MAAAAAGQMQTMSMNPVELFQLQQQQAQLQHLQQQMELQNYAMAAAASNSQMKGEEECGMDGEMIEQEDDEEVDEEMEPHYVPNPYAFGELTGGGVGEIPSDQENALLAGEDYSSNSNSSFLVGQQQNIFNALNAKSSTSTQTSTTKESFKKIKPVKRPGLVLKTPIAYQGDIDPSVIPIQRDGMGTDFFEFWFSFPFYIFCEILISLFL